MRSSKPAVGFSQVNKWQDLPVRSELIGRMTICLSFCSILAIGLATACADDPGSEGKESGNARSTESSEKRSSSLGGAKKDMATPQKVIRYAQHLMKTYDLNGDGELQPEEWKEMHGHPEKIDQNGDGMITLDELTRWLSNFGKRKQFGHPFDLEEVPDQTMPVKPNPPSEPRSSDSVSDTETTVTNSEAGEKKRDQKFYVSPKRLPAGLPEWFVEHDQDGDGQLTFSEYSPTGGAAELAEFERLDTNGDGLVTAKDYMQKGAERSSSVSKSTEGQSKNATGETPSKPSRKKKRGPAAPK